MVSFRWAVRAHLDAHAAELARRAANEASVWPAHMRAGRPLRKSKRAYRQLAREQARPMHRKRVAHALAGQTPGTVTFTVTDAEGHTASVAVAYAVQVPTTWTRPTGPGYTPIESLKKTGDTLTQAMARLTVPSVITFPEGLFQVVDFFGVPGVPTAQQAITIPHVALGVVGSGPGRIDPATNFPDSKTDQGTVFLVLADSSTVPLMVQDNKTPNPCFTIYHGTPTTKAPQQYGQFKILGSHQQNMYNGLHVTNPAGNIHAFDIYGFGGQANNGAPPGETFPVSISGGNGPHLVERIIIDGNHTGGGLDITGTLNAVVRNCRSARTNTSEMVFYQAYGTKTFDCEYGPPSINTATKQPTINHERTSGTVHTRVKKIGGVQGQNVDITHSNDGFTQTIDGVLCSCVDGPLELIDPDIPGSGPDGLVQIQSWTTGGYAGANDTMRTPPINHQSTGPSNRYRWIHGSGQIIN